MKGYTSMIDGHIDNERVLIYIPKDGEYIEILGHRIDGFDSFEAFCEHLKKYSEMEETINRQKAEIEELEAELEKQYEREVLKEGGEWK